MCAYTPFHRHVKDWKKMKYVCAKNKKEGVVDKH